MEIDMTDLFIIAVYSVGTVFGLYTGYNAGVRKGTQVTIDSLIENRFLKTRVTPVGIEIIQCEEE